MGLLLLLASSCLLLPAQDRPVITVDAPSAPIVLQKGAATKISVPLKIASGYHVNSNKPTDEYMIPMKLTWDASTVFEATAPVYPAGKLEKYPFSDQPLSVYTGDVVIDTPGKVSPSAAPGSLHLNGKLRYQACSERLCYPPKTIAVSIPVEIK